MNAHPLDMGHVPPFLRSQPGSSNPAGIDTTLAERDVNYGPFERQAGINQNIKRAMHAAPNWKDLADDMKESLELIASKIGRILNGDPNYVDSWHDIIGYALLIEKRLQKGDSGK